MIKGYTKPQLLIRQVLEILPDQEQPSLNAFTIGPQYDLFRYTNVTERAAMKGVAFVENTDPNPDIRQLVPYEGLQSHHIVDQSYVRLYGENLEGQLWTAESAVNDSDANLYDIVMPSLLTPNKLRVVRRSAILTATHSGYPSVTPTYSYISGVSVVFGGSGYAASTTIDQPVIGGTGTGAVVRLTTNSSGVVVSAIVVSPGTGYTSNVTFSATALNLGSNVGHTPDSSDSLPLIPELFSRPIRNGDIVYATLGSTRVRRTVRSVEREIVDSHFGADSGKSDKRMGASSLNPIASATASFGNTSSPANWGVKLAAGSILGVRVVSGGGAYTDPLVVTSDPITIDSGGLAWPAEPAAFAPHLSDSGAITGVDVTAIGAGYYSGSVVGIIITNGGTGYSASNPPRIQMNTPADGWVAVLEPVIAGGKITGVKILDPGWGYSAHQGNYGAFSGMSLVGGVGSGAQIIMVVNTGAMRSVAITDPGTGFATPPTVGTTGAGGTAFAATAFLGGVSLVPTVAGTGYAVNDVITVSGGTLGYGFTALTAKVTSIGVGGTVTGLSVVNAGGYSAIPSSPASTTNSGSGDNALTVTVTWGVSAVHVTNPGHSYASMDVTFTGGSGSGAAAEADFVGPVTISIDAQGGGGSGASLSFAFTNGSNGLHAQALDWNGLVEGSTYDSQYGERYTITVTKSGSGLDDARVRIRSASGAFSTNNAVAYHYGLDYVVNHPALGGLAIAFRPDDSTTPLRLGDVFSFVVIGAYKPLDITAAGQVLAVNIVSAGTSYTPGTYDLIFTAAPDGGVTAAGTAVVGGGGTVTSIELDNVGDGYLAAPVVTIDATTSGDVAILQAVVSTPENSRDLTVVQSGVYTGPLDTQYQIKVIKGTNIGATPDSFAGARVRVTDVSGIDVAQEYDITQGTQYDLGTYGLKFVFPTNLATPSGLTSGTTATVSVTLASGVFTDIDISSPGSGYTSVPAVTITDGAGSGATAHAEIYNGQVVAVVIDTPGSSYSAPTVTIDPPKAYQGGLRAGDVYYVNAVARKAAGPYSIIVLNGQASDISGWTELDLTLNKFDIDVRAIFTGLVEARRDTAPVLAWEAGTASVKGILLKDTLDLNVPERDTDHQWVPVKNSAYAKLFAHWRGLVPATSGDKIRLYQSEDAITTAFGIEDYDNPASKGALIAIRGAQGKPVYAAKLATADLAGYNTLIRQAEHIEGIYSIAPMGYDLAVGQALKAHVDKMSLENWKLWRRVYLGFQNPGKYTVMDTKEDGTNWEATITTNSSGNVRVICQDGDFVSRKIRPGDLFRVNYYEDEWGDPTFTEYTVYTVLEEDELILESGPALPINPAVKFEIWRPDNGLTQAEWAGDRAESFSDRRVISVWVDTPQQADANGEIQHPPVYYVAAEIAGLRSAVLPQQGLTYTELQYSLDACPLMFTKYTEEELNVAGAKGAWIVTQDHEDGPVYIRHQLTTDTGHGILYYEDSVGTNLDNISYATKAIFQPYIGKRNANPEVLEELETKARNLYDEFKRNPGGFSNIGPALIRWTNLKIAIDLVHKDHINMEVTLELPLPINSLLVILRGRTIQDDLVITTEILVANPNLA